MLQTTGKTYIPPTTPIRKLLLDQRSFIFAKYKPSQMSQNPQGTPDRPVARAADVQHDVRDSDTDDDRDTNWDSGSLIHPVRGLVVRTGFMDSEQMMPGQIPQFPDSRVVLQNSPSTPRRNSLVSPSQRLSPYRAAQSLSPARHGSPTTARRNRATQTPPLERKMGSSKKPDDPKES
ncbi:hypothetical protein JTE90_017873 [Oedothorax gibbosus]|uniref:Uncharacterized protein n=1 Tax=Oedothorax gibbosus TaxID=931172 RepID=A0AAV6V270_9ARAC|nr:hypothetical protein JTE90_017873 [Oedothorax gibbosus]